MFVVLLTACSLLAMFTVLYAAFNLVFDVELTPAIKARYAACLSGCRILFVGGLVAIAVSA